MKRKVKWGGRLIALFVCSLFFMSMHAQVSISGTVLDSQKQPLLGATVAVKGSTNSTITDLDGKFLLKVPNKNATLVFSYVGFDRQEVALKGKTNLEVILKENAKAIDEIVVVGYGTQKRVSITGSVSTVSEREMLKAPTMGITNIIGARVSGVSMLQTSGQPGADGASLLVRGQSAVYVVDGVQRSFNEIDPNEIESVSVLKDATSAAVYGLDASAVVIVTTKKGKNDKARISYSGSFGVSNNANKIEWLDGPGYAYYYNKARELDGDTPIFTADQVQKMVNGTDGWGNTNWYKKIFGTGHTEHHNVSVTSGNDRLRYFTSIGVFSQKGNVDKFNFDRYNFRTNVDSKIGSNISLELGLSARIEKRDRPRYSADPDDWHNIPQQAVRALPYVPERMTSDGKEYYTSTPTDSSPVSPFAAQNESGYNRTKNTYVQSNFSIKYDAPWLKGLSFKFMGAYDIAYQFQKSLMSPYTVLEVVKPNATTEKLNYALKKDNDGTISLTESAYSSTNVVTQSSVNFDRKFGLHKVNAIAVAETRNSYSNTLGVTGYGLDFLAMDELDKITDTNGQGKPKYASSSGRSSQARVLGFVGRVNYDYDERYLAEVSVRRDGSYLFSGMNGSRWVNLPAVSLGWRMNRESWFNADWINNLKLRGGIGQTATSAVNPYQYLDLMAVSTGQVVMGGTPKSIVYASVLGNSNLSWAKCLTYNAGVDFTAWNGLLGVEFDVFYKYQYDLLSAITGQYPPSMGKYVFTTANENKVDYKGFDFTITHNNHIGEFNYGAKLIGSFAKRRWLYVANDQQNTPEYMKLTGKEVGAKLGFIAEGLFQSQEDIDNSPTVVGYKVAPGYIKYRDINGDGKINYAQDMGYVGKSDYPKFQSSLNLNANYKGFDFDVLFQAGLGRTVALTGQYSGSGIMDNTAFTKMFYHGGNSPLFLAQNSWTPENTSAEFPRLSVVNLSNNNGFSSTFWYRSGDYLRMKSFQVGYSVPSSVLKYIGANKLRLYVEGSNIFTLSELTKYNIDPEQPSVNNGYYPQQKTFSFGINLTL